jgi:hypothetical protein
VSPGPIANPTADTTVVVVWKVEPSLIHGGDRQFYEGALRSLVLYDRPLTSAEVATLTSALASGSVVPPPPADTTAPVRSNPLPAGSLPSGSAQATLSLTTDENATCRYSPIRRVVRGDGGRFYHLRVDHTFWNRQRLDRRDLLQLSCPLC